MSASTATRIRRTPFGSVPPSRPAPQGSQLGLGPGRSAATLLRRFGRLCDVMHSLTKKTKSAARRVHRPPLVQVEAAWNAVLWPLIVTSPDDLRPPSPARAVYRSRLAKSTGLALVLSAGSAEEAEPCPMPAPRPRRSRS